MLAENDLKAIERIVALQREKPLTVVERRWMTRCALLTREVRRLTAELDASGNRENSESPSGDTMVF